MSLFSQYSVAPKLDLEIKPIPLTGNSVLTSGSVLNNKSELQTKPITYTPPKLDSAFLDSVSNSWSSFLDKSNAQIVQHQNLGIDQQMAISNAMLEEPKDDNNKTLLIVGISLVGVVGIVTTIYFLTKNKK